MDSGPGKSTASASQFANVAVNAGQPARIPFTYAVPEDVRVQVGQAVFVPFGPRILQAVVLELKDHQDVDKVRPIQALADPHPVLDAVHIELARWMSETYLAPLWDCVAACLPSGYGQQAVTMVSPVEVPALLPVYPQDAKILQYIAEHGRVSTETLREAVGQFSAARLQRLQKQGHLTVAQGLAHPAARPKFERRVELIAKPEDAVARARELEAKSAKSVDARVLRLAAAAGDVSLNEVRQTGAGPAHLGRLGSEGWIRAYSRQVERDPLEAYRFETRPPLVLSEDQQAAADRIFREPGTYLLHGVTGSGKTEVYLDLVRRTLDAGKSAIVLVPEISLTPQAIRRYGERYGETLTVLHSSLGTGELYDQWFRIQRGDARLVVGSRSAVFAPSKDLGLIVLDEEHEWTYKQSDPAPRYHARDVAEKLCALTGATLVLGSATPDIVTYHRSEVGAIHRVELRERLSPVGDGTTRLGQLPTVAVVDMRQELKAGNRSVFSFALARALRQALADGEQSILMVNRRGSARFMLCRECGHLPVCSSCLVALSLDLHDALRPKLKCHHCGRERKLEDTCPACDSRKYRPFGVGTQRIEQEAREKFPTARVARWDSDISGQKGSHERMVRALEAGEVDILVGTQMLAKGLDLPAMTVVGVVDADVGLSLPDYLAHERAFQLLSQVSGRAGRRDLPGWVFIQTYDPEAAPIRFAAEHDYRGFYEQEIAHRRRAGYPPFNRLARLTYRHSNYEHGLQEAARVADDLRLLRDTAGRADPDVLGPTPAYIARVRGEYRWQLLIRGREPSLLIGQVRLGHSWTVDIDPATLL